MRPLPFLLLVLFTSTKGFSQNPDDSIALNNAKTQSEKLADAFNKSDYSLLAHSTYPKVVKMMGGAERMTEVVTKSMADLGKQGIKFRNVYMGDAFSLVKTTTSWQCLLSQHMTVSTPQGDINSTTYLIGLSSDHGKTWSFVDTGKKDIAAMQKMLPEVSSQLQLPAQQ